MDLQTKVKETVRVAMEFAENSPAPEVSAELYSDVLLNPMPNMSPMGEYIHGAKNPMI